MLVCPYMLVAGARSLQEPSCRQRIWVPEGDSYVRPALATLCQLDTAQKDPGHHHWASALIRTQLRCPSCQWRRARWRLKSWCLWENEPGSLGDFLGWLAGSGDVFPRTL